MSYAGGRSSRCGPCCEGSGPDPSRRQRKPTELRSPQGRGLRRGVPEPATSMVVGSHHHRWLPREAPAPTTAGGDESSSPEGSAHDRGRCSGPSRWRSACACSTSGGAESAPPLTSPRRTGTAGTPVVMTHHHRRGRRKRLRATGGTTDLPSRGAGRPTPGGPTSGPTPTRWARGCGRIPCRRGWPGCVTGNVRGSDPVRTPYAPLAHALVQVSTRAGEDAGELWFYRSQRRSAEFHRRRSGVWSMTGSANAMTAATTSLKPSGRSSPEGPSCLR